MLDRISIIGPCILFCSLGHTVISEPASREIHDGDEVIEEVIVWGRAATQKGTAQSASEGLVGYADFSTRPLQRVGELVEVVPGMVATQHSGEGKANQYYLRGMNLDHGTDFSAYFEGMPINMRSHAHGQGYLDLNFLIPEVLSTVRYAKGPYAADRGDFSTAGTTEFAVYDSLTAPFVEVIAGSDNYLRQVAAGSIDTRRGHVLGAIEHLTNDGPWELKADVEKLNLLTKYTGRWDDADTKLLFTYYDNSWQSTDQVPQRLLSNGQLDRFGFVDPSLGGKSTRVSLIGGVANENWLANGFISRYKLDVFSNFTYFLNDPINGDQIEQVDRRWVYGGNVERTIEMSERVRLRVGGDLRYDDINAANLYLTTARTRRRTVRNDEVEWLSIGTFAELALQLTPKLRSTIGLRVDRYDYNVDAQLAANSGSDTEYNILPSVSFAYALNEYIELYANWGEGFHSNDVRGSSISIDPLTADPVPRVDLFVDQQGAELGMRIESLNGLAATLTYFWLESDSELLFVGDSGSTEPGDGSRRKGVELSLFWNINELWSADLLGSVVDSEFVDVPRGFDHIPNAPGRVFGAGITYAEPAGWVGSIRLRHFGDTALVEDDAISQDDTTVINAGLAYDFGPLELGIELINVLNAKENDIAYFFESRLAGEAAGVEDIHLHPIDPASARFNLRWEF